MPEHSDLKDPWLVAAWPGIGSVAVGAAAYLVNQLGATLVHELPPGEFFAANHVTVQEGIARAVAVPRSMFFEWQSPDLPHDLLFFLGEAQPASGGAALCRQIIDYAVERGVSRVFTFAAMATQLHPSARPRVFGAATDPSLLPALREFKVEVLRDGQIGGLNGILLAAGADRGLPSACLLGELPFFAAAIQNPKASMAVLKVFTQLASVEIDFEPIYDASAESEVTILDLLERMKEVARQQRQVRAPESPDEFGAEDDEDDREAEAESTAVTLDDSDRARLDALFQKAQDDRGAAFQLKEELDRLGVFSEYEGRFLDLFRRGE